jgi:phosphonate transport system ATP-binding protein
LTSRVAFELDGVGLTLGGRRVLAGIDLSLIAGGRVAVIGPSGAGKTSLLRLMAGFVWPTVGRVRALGRDTRHLRGAELRELRRGIGLLYQDDNLIAPLRVVHNVLAGRLGRWWTPRALLSLFWPQEIERAREALREVELAERLWDLPDTLSGGERQRVAIARLIVQEPRALLADEPASSLDHRLGRGVMETLIRIARERSSTLVVSMHTLDLIGEDFDRVLALREGELFWQGPPRELTRKLLREIYGAEYQRLEFGEVEIP